jgi:hypothetical protein
MRGGCRSFGFVNIFFVTLLFACGDNRGTGAAPVGSDQAGGPAVGAVPDTAASATDTGTSSATRVDSTPTRADSAPPPSKPGTDLARAAPAEKAPAPAKPAAPAPRPPASSPEPSAPAPSDSPPAAPPAQTADTAPAQTADTAPAQAQADAPLRDAYHQAPRDTVTQQAYDGWKQFNLLCARCHGEDVQGTTIAPHLVVSLKPNGPINTKELFVQTVCAGRPEKGMPAWCPLGLEMDKIEALYVYVKGRSEATIHPGRPAVKPEG